MIKEPTQSAKKRLDPFEGLQEYEKRGVDLTLLWENLRRTATERIENHQEMLALVEEAQRAGIKKYGQV